MSIAMSCSGFAQKSSKKHAAMSASDVIGFLLEISVNLLKFICLLDVLLPRMSE